MNWLLIVAIPVAIAGWVGMSFLTSRASRKNAGWEAPVPRERKRWWWPF